MNKYIEQRVLLKFCSANKMSFILSKTPGRPVVQSFKGSCKNVQEAKTYLIEGNCKMYIFNKIYFYFQFEIIDMTYKKYIPSISITLLCNSNYNMYVKKNN